MKRRIFLVCIILGLLALSSLLVVPLRALALTATQTKTSTSTAVPGADFVGTPLAGFAPLAVEFRHLNAGNLSSCTWTFGDGTSQSFAPTPGVPMGSCPSITHTYTTTGSFTVSLRVIKASNSFTNTMTKPNYITVTNPGEFTLTPTPTRTSGCGVIVVTSTPSPFFTPTPLTSPTPTRTSTACGVTYITATPDAPTLTPTPSPDSPTLTPTDTTGALPDLVVVSITEFLHIYPTATIKPPGCTSTPTWTQGLSVRVQNIGAADAGSFVVSLNSTNQQTVAGLAAGQFINVSFILRPTPISRTATADFTNLVVESDETNNSLTTSGNPGPTNTGTVPATLCRTFTPTQPIATWTPVITITVTPSPTGRTITPSGPTRTHTVTPSPTGRTITPSGPTRTHTVTPSPTGRTITPSGPSRTPASTQHATPTAATGVCSPVTAVITSIPFIFDGEGTFCWQASSLGGFINSWNTNSVSVNGQNVTNLWVGSGSYPAKINGFYYVSYNSSFSWGHFEARP